MATGASEDGEDSRKPSVAGTSAMDSIIRQSVKDRDSLSKSALSSKKATKTRLADFEIIKKIGDGAYSQVFKVKRKADGIIYALKKVNLPKFT